MDKPLKGIKVLDLSTFVAAPVTARLLADMGAEVIKIERNTGDNWRYTGINYVYYHFSHQENPVFDIYNTGKKLITVNLKTEEGMKIFFQLLEEADIFITNTRLAGLKRLGISYEDIKEKYPRLIYAMVTGYGEKGPDASLPAFDTTTFWPRCGMMRDMSVIGENGDYRPIYPPSGVGDTVTAYLLLAEINAALLQREKTGKGQFVEANLFHTGIFTFGTMIITNQRPWGRVYPTRRVEHSCPGGYYQCADGEWLFVATSMINKLVKQMCQATGREDLLEDERFTSLESIREHKEEVYEIFKNEFIKQPISYWLDRARELDFAAVQIKSFSDVAEDEQAWANDFLEHVTFENGAVDVMPHSPIHMETIGSNLKTYPASPLGGDNEEVLKSLGYSDEEIKELNEKGITNATII